MEARIQVAEAELARRDREHGAELARIEASAEARATALEEARADLRARAERAERELDQARANVLRAEEAETGTTAPARRTQRRNPGK